MVMMYSIKNRAMSIRVSVMPFMKDRNFWSGSHNASLGHDFLADIG